MCNSTKENKRKKNVFEINCIVVFFVCLCRIYLISTEFCLSTKNLNEFIWLFICFGMIYDAEKEEMMCFVYLNFGFYMLKSTCVACIFV